MDMQFHTNRDLLRSAIRIALIMQPFGRVEHA